MLRNGLLVMVAAMSAACGSASNPTADPGRTPAPAPSGWRYSGWEDPSLELALPSDWLTTGKGSFDVPTESASPSQDSETLAYNAWFGAMVKKGAGRLEGDGKVETPLGKGDKGYIDVWVEDAGDPSLQAFADRLAKDLQLPPISRETIPEPGGPAVRLDYKGTVAGLAFAESDYLFRLPDGRSLTVQIGGTATSDHRDPPNGETVRRFADRVIETLRVHSATTE